MTRRTQILEYIRANPGCTSADLRAAVLPTHSRQSVGAILGNLVAEGAVGSGRVSTQHPMRYRILGSASPLSPAQWRVLQFMVAGLSAKQAGAKLGITTAAAAERMRKAVTSLGARNRVHAAALAVARGLVHEDALRLSAPAPEHRPAGAGGEAGDLAAGAGGDDADLREARMIGDAR